MKKNIFTQIVGLLDKVNLAVYQQHSLAKSEETLEIHF